MNNIFRGKFGLERETLRVTKDGKMAQTNHPFSIDSLCRDFCENQLEIVTPVCDSIEEAVASLQNLSNVANEVLKEKDEYLWMCSNPPHIDSEDEIPIARYDGEYVSKHEYRIKLERRYGKKIMMYSGIHFNLSFDEKITGDAPDEFYMKLLKYTISYSWLLTLLTAASPVYDASFDGKNETKSAFDNFASMRNGERGYWNQFVPILDYSNVENYCASIKRYINKGVLFSEGELYLPVRIKSKGQNSLDRLKEEGVDHIELRMFDINPLDQVGIKIDDLKFAYLLLIYLSQKEDFDFNEELQNQAIENQKKAALFDLDNVYIDGVNIVEKAMQILELLREHYANESSAVKIIDTQLRKLKYKIRYAEVIYDRHIDDFQNNVIYYCVEMNR